MAKLQKKSKILLTVIFILLAAATFLLWVSRGENSRLKTAILRSLPVPVTFIQNRPVYSDELYSRLDSAKIVYSKTGFQQQKVVAEIYNRLVYETYLKILAHEKKASLNSWQDFADAPSSELQNGRLLAKAAQSQGEEDSFKFWFYSQQNLNQDAYRLADLILKRISEGESFEDLAKIYSQDKISAQLDGDLGPVLAENLMFEFKNPLLQAKQGETKILPSRQGLHIIQIYLKKISEEGKDVLYLKQIFLKGSDFEKWVKDETKNYKIIRIINI